jgi:hypothetical protein
MTNSFKNAINSGHGNALLYAGALGLLVSDIIPTPADAVYFRVMAKNKQKLDNGEITPKQYWTRETVFYYGLNPLWWTLFLGALYYTKGDYNSKVKVGLALLAGGAVIGVLNKNIKEEQKLIKKY